MLTNFSLNPWKLYQYTYIRNVLLILGRNNILALTEGLFGNMYLYYYILDYILFYPSKNLHKYYGPYLGMKKSNQVNLWAFISWTTEVVG